MTEIWAVEGRSFCLRQVLPTDLHDLYAIYSDPEVMRFASDPYFTSIELAERTIRSMRSNLLEDVAIELGIATLPARRIVGICSLQPACGPVSELGFLLRRSHWGAGIMLPAVRAFLAVYTDRLDLSQVDATIDPANLRSVRFAEKLGFRRIDQQTWSCEARHLRSMTTDIFNVQRECVHG